MPSRYDDRANRIATAQRGALVKMLRGMRCGFAIDFTDEYLNSLSLERLRHIAMAVSLHEIGQ